MAYADAHVLRDVWQESLELVPALVLQLGVAPRSLPQVSEVPVDVPRPMRPMREDPRFQREEVYANIKQRNTNAVLYVVCNDV